MSPSTTSVAIAVGAAAPVVANVTPGSTATIAVPAPVGTDTFVVTLYDADNAGGTALAAGTVTTDIVEGRANTVTIVCEGIVATLALTVAQPAPLYGLSQSIAMTLTAKDAGNSVIIAPGGYDNGPIEIADSDQSGHTQLQLGSAAPSGSVSVADPGATLSVVYDGSSAVTSATFTASMPHGATTMTPATAVITPENAQVLVDTANGSPTISPDILGGNLPAWVDNTQSYIAPAMATGGLHLLRWPGGSLADDYHWESPTSLCNGGYADEYSTFDAMMQDVAIPAKLDVAITVNYGSDAACTGPGTPSEAAAWVTYALNKNYNVPYWTVGNEVYGSWEYDLHTIPNDPTTYANAVTGTSGYYSMMKAANSSAKVGIVVGGPGYWGSWDKTVLPAAAGSFDFVEYHYYAQQGSGNYPGGVESDTYLLGKGVTDFANALTALRGEMTSYGVSSTVPIYLGELNSIVSTAGKQSVSITNGLFAGMAMAEAMKQTGVTMGTWWLAFGDCETAATGGNFSSSLYGWQNFGSYTLYSDQKSGCGTENSVTAGTPFPDGRAYAMLSQFAGTGATIRNVTLANSVSSARAYADVSGSNYNVLLFNLNEGASQTFSVQLQNAGVTQFTATQTTYGKAQYDLSKNNLWSGAVSSSLGSVGTTFYVTLPAWSINLISLVPVTDERHAVRRPSRN